MIKIVIPSPFYLSFWVQFHCHSEDEGRGIFLLNRSARDDNSDTPSLIKRAQEFRILLRGKPGGYLLNRHKGQKHSPLYSSINLCQSRR